MEPRFNVRTFLSTVYPFRSFLKVIAVLSVSDIFKETLNKSSAAERRIFCPQTAV